MTKYGDLKLNNGHWLLTGDPDVLLAARQRWPRLPLHGDILALPADAHTSYQLSYFIDEYDINVTNWMELRTLADSYRNLQHSL